MSAEYKQHILVPPAYGNVPPDTGDLVIEYVTTDSGQDDSAYAHGVHPYQLTLLDTANVNNRLGRGMRLTDETAATWVALTAALVMPDTPWQNLFFTATPPVGAPNSYPTYPSNYNPNVAINPASLTNPGLSRFPGDPEPQVTAQSIAIGPGRTYYPTPQSGTGIATPYYTAGEQTAEGNTGFWQLGFSARVISDTPHTAQVSYYNREVTNDYIELYIWNTATPFPVGNTTESVYTSVSRVKQHSIGPVDSEHIVSGGAKYVILGRKGAPSLGNGDVIVVDSLQLILHLIS